MVDVKVSIIVPVYNVEKYLKRCIESLQNQTLKEIEIILVDDSSKDQSFKICQEAAKEDPRIKVIRKQNEGAGIARNAGLKLATGKYIGFVDSDDFAEPHMFETLFLKAEQYQSDLVMSGVIYVGGIMFKNEGSEELQTFFQEDTQFITEEELKRLQYGIVGALPHEKEDSKYGMSVWKNLFRREIIETNGLQFLSEREMLSEDALFMVDYIGCIRKATGIPEALYRYFRNETSISKSYKKDRFEKGLVFYQQAKNRFQKINADGAYQIYLDRFWQAFCRVVCAQEILYAKQQGVKYSLLRSRLKTVCTNKFTRQALKAYPIGTLPVKQAIFAYAMKYRFYWIQKILVAFRSR